MRDKSNIILYCFGGVAVVWFALVVAPYIDGGLIEIIKEVPIKLENPFNIEWCENSIKTILIFLVIYVLGIGVYVSTKRNYRKGKEYGSALWGIASVLNKKYMQHPKKNNKILTQNVNIGFNAKKHRRNLNVLVVGRKWCWKNKILCKT